MRCVRLEGRVEVCKVRCVKGSTFGLSIKTK